MSLLEANRLNQEASRLTGAGEHEAALQCLERAIQLVPESPSLVCNYAVILAASGKSDRARQILQQVAAALPDDAESRIQLAKLLLVSDPKQARKLLLEAFRGLPLATSFICRWAHALMELGEVGFAARGLESLTSDQLSGEARSLLADLYCTLNRADEAINLYSKIDPDDVHAWAALSRARKETGDIFGALFAVDRAIELAGERPELVWNRALLRLMTGDAENGWPGLAARWEIPGQRLAAQAKPAENEWRGEALCGRRILVWEEQGFGDTLQFIRYISALKDLGAAQVIIEARSPLRRLLEQIPDVQVCPVGQMVAWDCHVPTFSLAAILAPDFGTLNNLVPYLGVPEPLQDIWRRRLGSGGLLTYGLVWAGGECLGDPVKEAMNARRSIPLNALAESLVGLPIRWVSLQTSAVPKSVLQIEDYSAELSDFMETAALISTLDAVVAVDTAVAHLAGALGKPVWLLNRIGGCWRWGTDGESTPWYPSMQIIRQHCYGDWHPALVELRKALQKQGKLRSLGVNQ